ncbi:unnamed protein product [Amoebophrya sp. A120]|nr:unnamed protein product [Amoebophrya sp. A120]|eukprot:GSA120T00022973001.1
MPTATCDQDRFISFFKLIPREVWSAKLGLSCDDDINKSGDLTARESEPGPSAELNLACCPDDDLSESSPSPLPSYDFIPQEEYSAIIADTTRLEINFPEPSLSCDLVQATKNNNVPACRSERNEEGNSQLLLPLHVRGDETFSFHGTKDRKAIGEDDADWSPASVSTRAFSDAAEELLEDDADETGCSPASASVEFCALSPADCSEKQQSKEKPVLGHKSTDAQPLVVPVVGDSAASRCSRSGRTFLLDVPKATMPDSYFARRREEASPHETACMYDIYLHADAGSGSSSSSTPSATSDDATADFDASDAFLLKPEHRIPVGFGFWDAAHALAVFLQQFVLDSRRPENSVVDHAAAAAADKKLHTSYALGVSSQKFVDLQDKRVIELGCGSCPLPGLVCAQDAYGARRPVLAVDYEPGVLELASHNVALNGCADEIVKVQRYGFGEPVTELRMDHGSNADSSTRGNRVLDAAKNYESRSQNHFDVILGADIAYVPADIQKKLRESLIALANPCGKTTLILAHSRRKKKEETRFLRELCSADGWELQYVFEDQMENRHTFFGAVAHNAQPDMMKTEIDIFIFERY